MLTTKNLKLRFPRIEDAALLKKFYESNQMHLSRWESPFEASCSAECERRLSSWKKECEEGTSVRFFIFTKDERPQIVGMCNFTQIFYGCFQACYLGYKIDKEYEGKGWMLEALQPALHYIFEEKRLHRIMANYMPINIRSARLLQRLGFVVEGYAKNYLFINNKWEDHVLTALSYEQWKNIKTGTYPQS